IADLERGRLLLPARLEEPIRELSLNHEGSLVLTVSAWLNSRLWDAADGRLLQTSPHAPAVLLPDGRGILARIQSGTYTRDTDMGVVDMAWQEASDPYSYHLSPDGKWVVAEIKERHDDRSLELRTLGSRRNVKTFPLPRDRGEAFSSEGLAGAVAPGGKH